MAKRKHECSKPSATPAPPCRGRQPPPGQPPRRRETKQVCQGGVKPYIEGAKSKEEALKDGIKPVRQFMLKQVREKDLGLFVKLSGLPKPQNVSELPLRVILPAFVISELRLAFQIGFVLFIPFLIIDTVVASVLLSMGMMLLPPIMVATPFKLLLFVLVDGWYLVVRSLVQSFY